MRHFTIALTMTLTCATAASADVDALHLDLDEPLMEEAAAMTRSVATVPAIPLDGVGSGMTARRPAGGFGIGLQVGTPTSLTLKFSGQGNADIVLGIGVGVGYNGFGVFRGLSIHGDYLFTVASLVNNGSIDLSAYIGPGVWIVLFDTARPGLFGGYYYFNNTFLGLAARMPLGLALGFAAAPIEVYLELDPALFIFPGIDGFIGASLGFRWFF